MNSGKHSLFLLGGFVCLALSACAASQPYRSPTWLQAREHHQRAVDAEARGQHPRAKAEFEAALRLSASIEDVDGTVTALVNLARLARRDGDLVRGRDLIEQARAKGQTEGRLGSEVAFEQALLLLAANDPVAAEAAARQTLVWHAGAAQHNLLARTLWQQRRSVEATAECRRALATVDVAAAPAEAANAHRLLAEMSAAVGAGAAAELSYRRALDLDRRAGLSKRIAADLHGLTDLAAGAGRIQDASGFLYRAFEVSLHGGDMAAALADLERLAALYRQSGDLERAVKVEAQRDSLQSLYESRSDLP